MAGSNFYTFKLINCVDIGFEQNQMNAMNYVVVDLVGSWTQQKVPKTQWAAEIQSSSMIPDTQYMTSMELLLNAN